jgi:hypothetical protein
MPGFQAVAFRRRACRLSEGRANARFGQPAATHDFLMA